jgi:hypothetical protein
MGCFFSRPKMIVMVPIAASLICAGCARDSSPPSTENAVASLDQPAKNRQPVDRENWEVLRINGNRIGYSRVTVQGATSGDRRLRRVRNFSQMNNFARTGQQIPIASEVTSLETIDGKLVEFEAITSQEKQTIQRTIGRTSNGSLQIEMEMHGRRATAELPWTDQCVGLYAPEQSLLSMPMRPGERRKFQSVEPAFNQLAMIEFAARDYEDVQLLDRKARLLRTDVVTTTAGQQLRSTIWTDESGVVLRRFQELMQIESLHVDKAVALEEANQSPFDLVLSLSVSVDRRLDAPLDLKRVRYRLQLDGGNPAELFVQSTYQRVRSLDGQTAEVTVEAARAGAKANPQSASKPPADQDREANGLIQSDHPEIKAIAAAVAPDEKDERKLATALEQETQRRISTSDYSQAFSSAAEVIKSGVGDCTEHAVLLAALARARGIPARVAFGLVYTEESGRPAFGYHMWNELYVDDCWVGFDATRPRGGISGAYLKLGEGNLDGVSAFSSLLPVAQVAGRLKITIEDVQ